MKEEKKSWDLEGEKLYQEWVARQEQRKISILQIARAIRRGKEHISNLYNRIRGCPEEGIFPGITNPRILNESYKVLKRFGITDRELEKELARMLVYSFYVKSEKSDNKTENDENKIIPIYITNLIKSFILNPEKEDALRERICEYASFRGSADYITIFYGIHTSPELTLTKAEAEILRTRFKKKPKYMSIRDLISTAKTSYEHSAATAEQILEGDFFRLSDRQKSQWEKRARLDEKILDNYECCLEILRTARYKYLN